MSESLLPPWRLEPLEYAPQACLCCPPRPITVPMNVDPHPGFGGCTLTRDGELHTDYFLTIHSTQADERVMQDFEDIAAGDPDHDWRLTINGPMYGCVYQRHGDAEWVMVEKLEGFA